MIKLYENGVYLLNGTEIVEDTGAHRFRFLKKKQRKTR